MEINLQRDILEKYNYFEGARHLLEIEGLSSPRVCNLLNRLVAMMPEEEAYLEVGTWKGLTLLSAAINNQGKTCFACDKFRFWGRSTGFGFLAKRTLLRNIRNYRQCCATIHFYHMESQDFLSRRLLDRPVGVFFYDGEHNYEGTFSGIVKAMPFLSARFILLMDDWNDPVIPKATYDAIRSCGLSALWSIEFRGDQSQEGWWDGLGVFWIEKKHRG